VPGSRFFRSPGARLTPDQWSHLLRMAWRVLRGEPPAGQLRPSRLLGTLGATSVLACPDKRGVLSDGTVSIKQLAFFQVGGEREGGLEVKGGAWARARLNDAMHPLACVCRAPAPHPILTSNQEILSPRIKIPALPNPGRVPIFCSSRPSLPTLCPSPPRWTTLALPS
jgi:hypothetical protein